MSRSCSIHGALISKNQELAGSMPAAEWPSSVGDEAPSLADLLEAPDLQPLDLSLNTSDASVPDAQTGDTKWHSTSPSDLPSQLSTAFSGLHVTGASDASGQQADVPAPISRPPQAFKPGFLRAKQRQPHAPASARTSTPTQTTSRSHSSTELPTQPLSLDELGTSPTLSQLLSQPPPSCSAAEDILQTADAAASSNIAPLATVKPGSAASMANSRPAAEPLTLTGAAPSADLSAAVTQQEQSSSAPDSEPAAESLQMLEPTSSTAASLAATERRKEASQAAFAALQPVCAALMRPRLETREAGDLLARLHQLLGSCSCMGLQACLAYVVLPLMYLVDSAAAARSGALLGSADALNVCAGLLGIKTQPSCGVPTVDLCCGLWR